MTEVFDNVHPSLRRAFHPVCRSSALGAGPVKVRLLGEDWVVARLGEKLAALPDRCPHRYSPLSAGCVVEGTLQCAYHGYRFAADGRCVRVPALGVDAAVPPKAHLAAAHSVIERYGLVWVAIEEPLSGILDVPEWDDPSFAVVPMPDQCWNAGAGQMVDNFLDLAHFPFTHAATFGDPDEIEVPPYPVERVGLGLRCDYLHSAKRLADSMGAEQFDVGTRRSTWWYEAPFSIRLRIEYYADDFVLTIVFFHQPVDAETTALYCFDLRNDIPDGRTTPEETVAFQLAVTEEDRNLLERIPTKDTPLDVQAEVHTRADRITLEMRRILGDYVAAADAASRQPVGLALYVVRITAVDPIALGYRKTDPPMARNFAVVRIETDAGLVGWGEASTNWGHSYPTVFQATVRDVCAAPLLGTDPTDVRGRIAQLRVLLDGYLGWEGLTSQVVSAIEIACWDLLGQAAGLPLHRLLGAANRPLRLYGTGTTMFEETAAYHASYFDEALAHGFGGFKVRLGRTVEQDVATVAAVRQHVGPDAMIGVDSYWFHDGRTALEVATALVPLAVGFFEEPVPQMRLDELAWLTARSPIPIAVGERVYSPGQFEAIARAGAANVFQPDASICGGIAACMEIAALARRRGIAVYPHVGGPTIVGLAANLHWAVAADVPWMEYDIDPWQPLVDDVGGPAIGLGDLSGGVVAAPDGPGLGVSLPDDVAARFPFVTGDTYAEVFPDHEKGRAGG